VRTVQIPLPAAVSDSEARLGPMLPGAALAIAALEPTMPTVMTDAARVGAFGLTIATPTPIAALPEAGTCCAALSTLTKVVVLPPVVAALPGIAEAVLAVALPAIPLCGN